MGLGAGFAGCHCISSQGGGKLRLGVNQLQNTSDVIPSAGRRAHGLKGIGGRGVDATGTSGRGSLRPQLRPRQGVSLSAAAPSALGSAFCDRSGCPRWPARARPVAAAGAGAAGGGRALDVSRAAGCSSASPRASVETPGCSDPRFRAPQLDIGRDVEASRRHPPDRNNSRLGEGDCAPSLSAVCSASMRSVSICECWMSK